MKNFNPKFSFKGAALYFLIFFVSIAVFSDTAKAFIRTADFDGDGIVSTCSFSPEYTGFWDDVCIGTGKTFCSNVTPGSACTPPNSRGVQICRYDMGRKDCSCTPTAWTPEAWRVCSGTAFTQSDGCSGTQSAVGTKTPGVFMPNLSSVCIGESFTQTDSCTSRTAVGTKGSWEPSVWDYCVGVNFTQTNSCNGTTRAATGTDVGRWLPSTSDICTGQTFTQTNTCTSATRSRTGTGGGAFSPLENTVCLGDSFIQSNSCTSRVSTGTNASLCATANGVCDLSTRNSCTSGQSSPKPDTLTQYQWDCLGTGNPVGTTISCAIQKPALNICPSSISLGIGSTNNLKAYYTADGESFTDCGSPNGTDVTPVTTWTSTDSSIVSVDLTGRVRGERAGLTSVIGRDTTPGHGNLEGSVSVSVTCVESVTCASEQNKVCSGEVVTGVTIAGNCGPISCNGLEGTRQCDFNWKEVSP